MPGRGGHHAAPQSRRDHSPNAYVNGYPMGGAELPEEDRYLQVSPLFRNRNSLVQRGTTYWNGLSDSLKSALTLSNFTKKHHPENIS